MRDRRSHFDVTNTINVSDPHEVCTVVCGMLAALYPRADLSPVKLAFDTFAHLYAGILPGYHGCDTWYHDVQHSLDCTLAIARLVDGHERSVPKRSRIGERRARLGVILALFHDAGYIRRYDESEYHNGAEFTFYHVTRSANFLLDFLPKIGFGREARLAARLVHFTGYEIALPKINVHNRLDRKVGFMLGTADLIAQMADRCYLEKCKSYLFHEFRACGLAAPGIAGGPAVIYRSPEDLVRKTPGFVDKLFAERLDGYFHKTYRYLDKHFNGTNPYMFEIEKHVEHLRRVIATDTIDQLRRRPRSINARVLRESLGVRLSEVRPRRKRVKLAAHRRANARILRAERPVNYLPT